jgi:hypothetical protein
MAAANDANHESSHGPMMTGALNVLVEGTALAQKLSLSSRFATRLKGFQNGTKKYKTHNY